MFFSPFKNLFGQLSGTLDIPKMLCILWLVHFCVHILQMVNTTLHYLILSLMSILQNYYSVYGGQQFSPYYATSGAAGPPGIYHNFYPFYAQYAQSSQAQGFGVQCPQMVQYPYLPQNYGSTGILSLPSSMPTTNSTGDIF